MDKHIDVLVPTIGREGLPATAASVLQQTYQDWRLNILADGYGAEVRARLRGVEDPRVRIVDIPGGSLGRWGHPATRWAIENLDLRGHIVFCGDDDTWYPAAFQSFADAMGEDVGMVLGVAEGMSKAFPGKFVRWLGKEVRVCEVTGACGCYSLKHVHQLEKPVFLDSSYDSDWKLISRMLRFPHKQIPAVVVKFPLTGS